jgi:hypothetical protein
MPELTNIAMGREPRPQEVDKFRDAFRVSGEIQEIAADKETADSEIRPIAEKIAIVATIYATELTAQWQVCIHVQDRQDQDVDGFLSTQNLTNPTLHVPPSKNLQNCIFLLFSGFSLPLQTVWVVVDM